MHALFEVSQVARIVAIAGHICDVRAPLARFRIGPTIRSRLGNNAILLRSIRVLACSFKADIKMNQLRMTVQFCFAFDGNWIKAFPKRKILNDDMT